MTRQIIDLQAGLADAGLLHVQARLYFDPAKVLVCGSDGTGRYLGLWVADPGHSDPATGILWDSKLDRTNVLEPLLSDLDSQQLQDFFADLDPADNETD